MKLNQDAVKKAKELIRNGKYVEDSDWSKAQPSPDDENKFLDKNGYEGFREWYLGIHEDASKETKGRFGFPYGDFKKLHRDGLIAAKQRAAQNDYNDIEKAADELLQMLDDEREKG